jgi:hypothetical protein
MSYRYYLPDTLYGFSFAEIQEIIKPLSEKGVFITNREYKKIGWKTGYQIKDLKGEYWLQARTKQLLGTAVSLIKDKVQKRDHPEGLPKFKLNRRWMKEKGGW